MSLVTGFCVTEWVERLVGNEIELGMGIPTIESRTSNISPDKGIAHGIDWILDIVVQPIKIFVEYVGVNMRI